MKQTAVEWLIEQLKGKSQSITWNEIFNKAKEIEKQQIIEAYGVKVNHSVEQGTTVYTRTFGEEYYNEKFKK